MREFFADPEGTREELLAATYRALTQHGYAELSLQTIGTEFSKSTSLIYHHYESKDQLVVDCLDAMLDQLEANIAAAPEDPHASIRRFLGMITADPQSTEYQFMRALTEIRGHAPHDAAFRAAFTRADRVLQKRLRVAIEAGVEQDIFTVEAVSETVSHLYTLLTGVMIRRTTTEDALALEPLHAEIERLLGAEFPRVAPTA